MAQELAVSIAQEELLQVEVEMQPMLSIIVMLNNHIKNQEERIEHLEEFVKSLVGKDQYEKDNRQIIARVEQSEACVSQAVAKVDTLAKNLQNLEDRIGLTITERLNDSLVSTKMQIRAATQSLDQQLQKVDALANANKKRIDEIERDDSLKLEIAKLKENEESIKSTLTELREIAENKGLEEMNEINSRLNQVESGLDQVVNDVNSLKEALKTAPPETPQNEPQEDQGSTSPKSKEEEEEDSPVPETVEEQLSRLHKIVGTLQEEFDGHKVDVIEAMNALQDELQLIRDNGRGLGGLPPINLVNVVPAFFHEPPPESKQPKKTETKNEPTRPPPRVINLRKRAGTVTRKTRENVLNDPAPTPEPEKVSTEQQTDPIPVQVIQAPPIDEEAILEKLRHELDFDGIKEAFKKFSDEHAAAMSALDRKIDREYVERLFDKFRVLVHGLNERVKELASINGDYATREDVALLAQILKKMPTGKRPATALKKGPGCLFCGKARGAIVGEISPRTAAMAGKPAVGSVLTEGNKSEFVYGDGQAFKRGEEFQSFPNLDTLPRLAENVTNE